MTRRPTAGLILIGDELLSGKVVDTNGSFLITELRTIGIDLGEIAVIGDNSHDLEMARSGGAGLAIGVLSGNGTREALEPLADVILASVADLPSHLGVI